MKTERTVDCDDQGSCVDDRNSSALVHSVPLELWPDEFTTGLSQQLIQITLCYYIPPLSPTPTCSENSIKHNTHIYSMLTVQHTTACSAAASCDRWQLLPTATHGQWTDKVDEVSNTYWKPLHCAALKLCCDLKPHKEQSWTNCYMLSISKFLVQTAILHM